MYALQEGDKKKHLISIWCISLSSIKKETKIKNQKIKRTAETKPRPGLHFLKNISTGIGFFLKPDPAELPLNADSE